MSSEPLLYRCPVTQEPVDIGIWTSRTGTVRISDHRIIGCSSCGGTHGGINTADLFFADGTLPKPIPVGGDAIAAEAAAMRARVIGRIEEKLDDRGSPPADAEAVYDLVGDLVLAWAVV